MCYVDANTNCFTTLESSYGLTTSENQSLKDAIQETSTNKE